MNRAPWLLCLLVPLLMTVLPSCGGASASSSGAEGSSAPEREAQSSSEAPEEDASESSAPAKSACTDESCFACGEGFCLRGFYCDASAGPACSWLPECAKDPSCACITRILGTACSCSDSSGGPQVQCS